MWDWIFFFFFKSYSC